MIIIISSCYIESFVIIWYLSLFLVALLIKSIFSDISILIPILFGYYFQGISLSIL